jgi:hypothetical protein
MDEVYDVCYTCYERKQKIETGIDVDMHGMPIKKRIHHYCGKYGVCYECYWWSVESKTRHIRRFER